MYSKNIYICVPSGGPKSWKKPKKKKKFQEFFQEFSSGKQLFFFLFPPIFDALRTGPSFSSFRCCILQYTVVYSLNSILWVLAVLAGLTHTVPKNRACHSWSGCNAPLLSFVFIYPRPRFHKYTAASALTVTGLVAMWIFG